MTTNNAEPAEAYWANRGERAEKALEEWKRRAEAAERERDQWRERAEHWDTDRLRARANESDAIQHCNEIRATLAAEKLSRTRLEESANDANRLRIAAESKAAALGELILDVADVLGLPTGEDRPGHVLAGVKAMAEKIALITKVGNGPCTTCGGVGVVAVPDSSVDWISCPGCDPDHGEKIKLRKERDAMRAALEAIRRRLYPGPEGQCDSPGEHSALEIAMEALAGEKPAGGP